MTQDDITPAEQESDPSQESLTPVPPATKLCPFCNEEVNLHAKKCKHCGETIDVTLRAAEEGRGLRGGAGQNIVVQQVMQTPAYAIMRVPKNRGTYIVLAVLLGGLGIHNFYAGYAGRGIIQLLLGISTVGVIISYPCVQRQLKSASDDN